MTTSTSPTAPTDANTIRADLLRSLHASGTPLVLVNVWDAASARRVAAAGAAAIGTSSAAIADCLGVADDNTIDPDLAFDAIRRIARAVELPVTADVEGGWGLTGDDLVERLLAAGAVGCNVEDSDHRNAGQLVDPEAFADRLAGIRSAAARRGVPIVVNARTDVLVRADSRDPDRLFPEILRRARAYLAAGADCVYPVGLVEPAVVRRLVDELQAPVNANLGGDVTIGEMAEAGAARISFGPRFHAVAMAGLAVSAAELLRR